MGCSCCTPKCALNYHIAMAIVGLLAGLISFFVFDFYYGNYHAGIHFKTKISFEKVYSVN